MSKSGRKNKGGVSAKEGKERIECNGNISKEQMIEIQAEAYYRAIKRIENEKTEQNSDKSAGKTLNVFYKILFAANVLIWPWNISKKFKLNSGVYDSVLVLLGSFVMKVLGLILWVFSGALALIAVKQGFCSILPLSILPFFWGSILILAGKEFGKEQDSMKIYAYTASLFSFISCIVGVLSLIATVL